MSRRLRVYHLITVTCLDVCADDDQRAFGGIDNFSIDAVFLDLPEPWKTIPQARKVLKPGRSLCCYSPCIEQVLHEPMIISSRFAILPLICAAEFQIFEINVGFKADILDSSLSIFAGDENM